VRVQLPCLLVRARGTLGMGGGPAACALVELAPLLCHCLGRSRLSKKNHACSKGTARGQQQARSRAGEVRAANSFACRLAYHYVG
jgi:hypothetical protein